MNTVHESQRDILEGIPFQEAPLPVNCTGEDDETDCVDDPQNPCRACFLWSPELGRSTLWDEEWDFVL